MSSSKKTHLIIGCGEVGTAIKKVLRLCKEVDSIDVGEAREQQYDFVHICFPYTKSFIRGVIKYKLKYLRGNGILVVHSTVPVGVCRLLYAVHSPLEGRHPHLAESVTTFKKYFSGPRAEIVAKEFRDCGVKTQTVSLQENTEAAKLWSTTQYAWFVILNKEIHSWCRRNGIDFDFVYNEYNRNYNESYERMGEDFVKPILKYTKGRIGGHCLIPNCKLLGGSWLPELILKKDKEEL